MPEPRPERQPGETLAAYTERLSAWAAEQNKAPEGTNKGGPPPGVQVPGTERYVEAGKGPNGTNVVHEKQPDGSYRTSYTAVGAPRTGGGTGGTATPQRDFAAENAANKSKQQIASGASPTPPPGVYVLPGGTRAVDRSGLTTWTKDPVTGNWTNAGFPPNAMDKQAALRVAMAERQNPTTTATPQTTTTASVPPSAPLVSNPLQGNQAPLLSSFSNFTTPGAQVSGDNRRTMFTGNEMNTLLTSRSNPNGPYIPAFGVTGLKPENSGNNYNFTPQSTLPAYAQFPNTAFSVPDTYVKGASGYGGGGDPNSFTAFGVPINVTGPSATGPGGAGSITVQGPQNATIGNTGYSLSPFAYNSFGATYGRNLQDDAATRAVETAMLLNAQRTYGPEGAMRLLTAPDQGIFTGQPGLYGNMQLPGNGEKTDYGFIFTGNDRDENSPFQQFDKGGRVASRPLASADQVIREPSIAIGLFSRDPKFIMSEKGPEIIRDAGNGMMDIIPMHAAGAKIDLNTPDPMPVQDRIGLKPNVPNAPDPGPYVPDAPIGLKPNLPPPNYDDLRTTNPVTEPVFDPLDPSILQPWSQAAQANRMRDANIRRFNYRNDFAGLGAPIAIQVEEGDIPNAPLPPGVYYDTSNQVNRVMGDIVNAQDQYRNLPPTIDTNPLYTREGEISTQLGLFDTLRNLQQARVGAAATDAAAKANAQLELNAANADYAAAQNAYTNALNVYQMWLTNQPPIYSADYQTFLQAQQAYLNSIAKLEGIQTNISQLNNRINSTSPELMSIDARLGELGLQTQNLNEGSLNTERGLIRSQLANNQQRMDKAEELKLGIQNLRARNVPKISAPILPVMAA